MIENAVNLIDTVIPLIFNHSFQGGQHVSDRSNNLTDTERFIGLMLTFDKPLQSKSKFEMKNVLKERIDQLRSGKLLNVNFAEICISSALVDALKTERFILNSLSEQLYSIYLTNYFVETLGKPEFIKQKPKRRSKRAKKEKIKEEKCELKTLIQSDGEFDEISDKFVKESQGNILLANTGLQFSQDCFSKPSEFQQAPAIKNEKKLCFGKIKVYKLQKPIEKIAVTNPDSQKDSIMKKEDINPFAQKLERFSESSKITSQIQNLDINIKHSEFIAVSKQIIPLLSVSVSNVHSDFQLPQVQSREINPKEKPNNHIKSKFYIESQKDRVLKRQMRSSSQSAIKPPEIDMGLTSDPNVKLRENPVTKGYIFSPSRPNLVFDNIKIEKLCHRTKLDKPSLRDENFDVDQNSILSRPNSVTMQENGSSQKNTNIVQKLGFGHEVNFSNNCSQLSSQSKGKLDMQSKIKAKMPKLAQLVKGKSGKEATKQNSSIHSNNSHSLRNNKRTNFPERSTNNSICYQKSGRNDFYSSTSDVREKTFQYGGNIHSKMALKTTSSLNERILKQVSNLAEEGLNTKSTSKTIQPDKAKTSAVKEQKGVVQIKRILTWNKDSDEENVGKKEREKSEEGEPMQENQEMFIEIKQKVEYQNSLPSSSPNHNAKFDISQTSNVLPKKTVNFKVNRWDHDCPIYNKCESVEFSQNSEVNLIDNTRYMSNESQSANERKGNPKKFSIQQHNIFHFENQKCLPPLRKFPKGFFRRADIQVVEFTDQPAYNLARISNLNKCLFDSIFFRMIDSSSKAIIADLESFSRRFEQPRLIVKDRIQKIVHQTFLHPAIYVSEYGSFSTTLLTPYSDLDLAIRGCYFDSREQCILMLNTIYENLTLFPFIKKVTKILTAAIPVLKIEADPSIFYKATPTAQNSVVIKVDLIIEQFEEYNTMSTAIRTTEFTKNCNRYYKTFYQNVLLMKFALSCNSLSNSYQGNINRRFERIRLVLALLGIY
jgi:hypothetical protein